MEFVVRPSELAPLHMRAEVRLDAVGGDRDSVGRMIAEMPGSILAAWVEMIPLGLVTSG